MHDSPLADISRSLVDGVAALRAGSKRTAYADTRIAALVLCESVTRQVEQLTIELIAGLDTDSVFTDRGYTRPALAVADLLGWDISQAVRRVKAAEQVVERVTLAGEVLPARLAATAAAFAGGGLSLRHVEVITEALDTPAATRLTPQDWAGVEEQLAGQGGVYRPRELAGFARELITTLDHDGPVPDERELPQLNELHLTRNQTGTGGRIKASLDAPTFDALATALDVLTRPAAGDTRTIGERQADALGQVCRHTLDRGVLPTVGGQRPHLNIVIPLTELEGRARNGVLDYGGQLTPTELRVLACDAKAIPVILGAHGQPLDMGRAVRTVPAHLRRAVAIRDKGCAFPGCGRPPSWCEVHHIKEWQHGGRTDLDNLVMFCCIHHRLLHHSPWTVRIHHEQPEFIPPTWIDPHQTPRRKPPPNHIPAQRQPALALTNCER